MRAAFATVLALGSLSLGTSDSFVPVYLWSQQPYFAEDGSRHVDAQVALTQSQFVTSMDQFLEGKSDGSTGFARYFSSQGVQPEVVLAFVHQQLGSSTAMQLNGAYDAEAGSNKAPGFAFLQQAVSGAASSLVLPFVGGAGLSQRLGAAVQRASPRAQTLTFSLAVGGCDALLQELRAKAPPAFDNGVADLLVVRAAAPQAFSDACLARVSRAVDQATGGKTLQLLSADAAPALTTSFAPQLTELSARRPALRQLAAYAVGNSTAVVDYPGPQYLTSSILLGLVVTFIMVFITLCGVSCLMSIETPVRFGDKMLQIGKEY